MADGFCYEVDMLFSVSLGPREINNMLSDMGIREQVQIKDAGQISVKQVLADIPDDAYIGKVADILRENYKTDSLTVTECRFVGFRSVRRVSLGDIREESHG